VAWPDRKSLKIDGLDMTERHLLVVLIQKASRLNRSGSSFRSLKALTYAWLTTGIKAYS
jgi:hypothetical protein